MQRSFGGPVGIVVALLFAFLSSFAVGPNGNRTAKRTTPLQWGLYQILWSRDYQDQLGQELARLGLQKRVLAVWR